MVALSTVRTSNTSLSTHPPPVAIFVGGTSGIGLYTARELARNTTSPHIYLIGRSQTSATSVIAELKAINPSSQVSFIQKDISLLRNVDDACAEIKRNEKSVNLLFMTCGYFVFTGRSETPEGLDKKFSLHYYARMRFVDQLQPLLTAASTQNQLSRVVAVLDPNQGLRFVPNFADLSLKTTFSLRNCATHASAMTNLTFARLASENKGTAYVHAFPSFVETGAGRDAWGGLAVLGKPIAWAISKIMEVKPQESGERHLYAATSAAFGAQDGEGEKVLGSDGVVGSGSYLVNWNGDILADTARAKAMREEGKGDLVREHTEDVFRRICEEGGKY